MSKIPSCPVRIEDRGTERAVTIEGPHFDMGKLRKGIDTFVTFYSKELIKMIYKLNGSQYLKDEIRRAEEPMYIQKPLEDLLRNMTSLANKVILDFGSGGGASAISLCRMGATQVHGVDIQGDLVQMGRLRAKECGFEGAIVFHHVEDTTHLPFSFAFFDIIVCNGVLEHIPPKQRIGHLQELWRVLKIGGLLFITGTPNRLWPIDGHTTGLPFVPYLPIKAARLYSVLFSKNVSIGDSADNLILRGIRGVTYWEIRKGLENCVFLPNDDLGRFFKHSLSSEQSNVKRKIKTFMKHMYKLLDSVMCEPFSVPVAAFLPYLSLCFKKR